VEGRGWATRVVIDSVNWQQEEPAGLRRKAVAFNGRYEPDESRGSSPDL
jgi:hypothetical protein